MKKTWPWNSKLWGVKFTGSQGDTMILGTLWHCRAPHYAGAPTRTLLFTTRKAAREWCKSRNDKWPVKLKWHVRPVRVLETVRELP